MKKGSINGRVLGQCDEEYAQVLFTQSSRPLGELLKSPISAVLVLLVLG